MFAAPSVLIGHPMFAQWFHVAIVGACMVADCVSRIQHQHWGVGVFVGYVASTGVASVSSTFAGFPEL